MTLNRLRLPTSGCLFGAAMPGQSGRTRAQEVAYIEAIVERPMALDYTYRNMNSTFSDTRSGGEAIGPWLNRVWQAGRLPMISIIPRSDNAVTTKYPWGAIGAGTHDAVLDSSIAAITAAMNDAANPRGGHIFVCFQHEPDDAEVITDPPTSPGVTAGTGGSLAAATYEACVATLAPNGVFSTREGLATSTVSVAVAASGTLQVTWTKPSNIDTTSTRYRVYYRVAAGTWKYFDTASSTTSYTVTADTGTTQNPTTALPAGQWGTVADHAAATLRVHNRLIAAGIRHRVSLGVCLTRNAYDQDAKLPAEAWYPTDKSIVDWIGADVYNIFKLASASAPWWTIFSDRYTPPGRYGAVASWYDAGGTGNWRLSKKVILPEVGTQDCYEDANVTDVIDSNGRYGAVDSSMASGEFDNAVADWITDMGNGMQDRPEIAGFAWFQQFGHQLYQDETGSEVSAAAVNAKAAYRAVGLRGYFQPSMRDDPDCVGELTYGENGTGDVVLTIPASGVPRGRTLVAVVATNNFAAYETSEPSGGSTVWPTTTPTVNITRGGTAVPGITPVTSGAWSSMFGLDRFRRIPTQPGNVWILSLVTPVDLLAGDVVTVSNLGTTGNAPHRAASLIELQGVPARGAGADNNGNSAAPAPGSRAVPRKGVAIDAAMYAGAPGYTPAAGQTELKDESVNTLGRALEINYKVVTPGTHNPAGTIPSGTWAAAGQVYLGRKRGGRLTGVA